MTEDLGSGQTQAGDAVITERRAHQWYRQAHQPGERHQSGEWHQPGERHRQFPAAVGRLAAGWWAAVMVAGLAMAPEVMRAPGQLGRLARGAAALPVARRPRRSPLPRCTRCWPRVPP